MSEDLWSVSLSISALSDGVSWRISAPKRHSGEQLWTYGSQRTVVARALDPGKVYDTLKATTIELVTEGYSPWLF